MVKLVYCVRRREDVPADEFRRYWLEEHGPRVKAHAEALRAVRYVQSHTIDSPLNDLLQRSRGGKAPYDGITEVWWEDESDFQEAMSTTGGEAASMDLLEDERRFIDLERSRVFLTQEHEIFSPEEVWPIS